MPPYMPDNEVDGGVGSSQLEYGDASGNGGYPQEAAFHNPSQSRSSYSAKPNPDYIPFLERLRRIPTVREIPWRAGQELPIEKAEDSPRVQQRGAILLSTRGGIQQLKCSHCARGYGRFSLCITMEPWFQGACSSCIFTSKGNKCSLRFQTSGTADGRALRYHTENPDPGQSYIRNVGDVDENTPRPPTKKRKRRSLLTGSTSINTSFSSDQRATSPAGSPDLDTMLQADIARCAESDEQDPEPIRYTKKEKPHTHPQHAEVIPLAHSKAFSWTPTNPKPISTEALPNSSKSRDAAPGITLRWAAVNGQKFTPPAPAAVTQPRPPPPQPQPGPTSFIGVSSVPLIDALPKVKQRQILSLVGGIEGGIEHMTAQLVSLKSLLGITDAETRQ